MAMEQRCANQEHHSKSCALKHALDVTASSHLLTTGFIKLHESETLKQMRDFHLTFFMILQSEWYSLIFHLESKRVFYFKK